MADRYWVGGTGNWSDTARWSTSSGGSSGASVPTSADNVFFDNNSAAGTFTVTIDTNSSCLNFDASGITNSARKMTLTPTTGFYLSIFGNWVNPTSTYFATTSVSSAGIIFAATSTGYTFTTNAVSFTCLILFGNGSVGTGGGWKLVGSLTSTTTIFFRNGTFDTDSANNYSVTASSITADGAQSTTVNLNASSVALNGTTSVTISNANLTLNAGTSTITCSNAAPTFTGAGKTFYNVTFSSTAITGITFTGANTYNNLTIAAKASAGIGLLSFPSSATQTVNGTFSVGSGAGSVDRRYRIAAATIGTQATISAATVSLTNIDIRDIVGSGAASPFTGTSLGDCTNNSGITFTTAKQVYWSLAAGGTWNATAWATGSGGTPAAANFPLAQDTCIIDNTGLTAGNTITINANWQIGAISSTRTASWTLAYGTATPTFYKDFTLDANATMTGTVALTYANLTAAQIITMNGIAFSANVQTYSSILRLNGNVTVPAASTFILNQGTLDLTYNGAGNYTLSTGLFSSSGTATRSITFGTGNITLTGTSTAANITIWSAATVTGMTVTGTPSVYLTGNSTANTRTVQNGSTAGGSASNAISIYVAAGSDNVICGGFFNYIDYTNGGTGTFTGTANVASGQNTIYNDLTLSSGMGTVVLGASYTFAGTSGTQKIKTNGAIIDSALTQNNSGATLQLQDNLTMGSTRTFTLTSGTLDLNSKTLSTGIFSSNNSNTRSISFGTGNLNLTAFGTGTTNIFVMNTVTGFSYTGTSKVTISGAGTSGNFRQLIFQTGATESNSLNYYVNNGADQIIMQSFYCKTLDFTGFSGSVSDNNKNIYGNLVLSSTMTYSNSTGITSFIASSGTQTLTTNGTTLDAPLTQNNSGATLQLQDNLTLGSTRTYTHTSGTLDINAKTATIDTFSSTGAGTRAITFNSGTLSISGTTTSAFTASGSNLTTSAGTGVGTISLTAATAKTFAGGGFTYAAKLNQGGAGALTITGSNTFNNITATTLPSTITFTAGTTQTVTQFTASGTAGNLLTLNSSSAGSPFTLSDSSGTINVSYCSITDSTATGGATWNSLLTNGNVDGGGNTGWIFTVAPVYAAYLSDIKLRSMAQRGRF